MTDGERSSVFERPRRQRMADVIFEKLAQIIVSGELSPGSMFPSERLLAARFDVSRLIIRQAVHRLNEMDLVRVRQGGPTLVCDPAECDHPLVLVLALRWSPDRKSLRRDLQERQMVGSLAMLLLAERRIDAAALGELRSLVDGYDAQRDDLDEIVEEFWLGIAHATHNSFFRRETRYWFRIVREHRRMGQHAPYSAAGRVQLYRSIVEHLEQRTGAAATYLALVRAVLDEHDSTSSS